MDMLLVEAGEGVLGRPAPEVLGYFQELLRVGLEHWEELGVGLVGHCRHQFCD